MSVGVECSIHLAEKIKSGPVGGSHSYPACDCFGPKTSNHWLHQIKQRETLNGSHPEGNSWGGDPKGPASQLSRRVPAFTSIAPQGFIAPADSRAVD